MLIKPSIPEVSSTVWFDDLDRLVEVISPGDGDTDEAYEPVRIAILDTGIKPNDRYARFIKGYKDFVTGDDTVRVDNTGHGTNGVKLIYKVCPNAQVFVARVFENSVAGDETQKYMAQARYRSLTPDSFHY